MKERVSTLDFEGEWKRRTSIYLWDAERVRQVHGWTSGRFLIVEQEREVITYIAMHMFDFFYMQVFLFSNPGSMTVPIC